MKLLGKRILEKLKRKNLGNISLSNAIDKLIIDLEEFEFKNQLELLEIRKDADCVHNDGFFFFNISIHRTLVLIEFEENGQCTIVWGGSHDEYELIFKNNKNSIKKWLKDREWIK